MDRITVGEMCAKEETYAEGCATTVHAASGNLSASDELWLGGGEGKGAAGEGQEERGLEKHDCGEGDGM